MNGIKRTFRYYWLRFLRLQGNPQPLARGGSIGVFIGLTPTLPFHTIAALIITFITRTSFIAAVITGVLVCNPLTYIPIYWLSLVIGNAVTPYELNWEMIKSVLNSLLSDQSFADSMKMLVSVGYEATIVMLVGGFILALPFAVVSYFFSLKLFIKIREKSIKSIFSINTSCSQKV